MNDDYNSEEDEIFEGDGIEVNDDDDLIPPDFDDIDAPDDIDDDDIEDDIHDIDGFTEALEGDDEIYPPEPEDIMNEPPKIPEPHTPPVQNRPVQRPNMPQKPMSPQNQGRPINITVNPAMQQRPQPSVPPVQMRPNTQGAMIRGNLTINNGITCNDNIFIEGATINGDIKAYNVTFGGIINGNIFSNGIVTLLRGAEVHGNITAKSVTISGKTHIDGELIIED